MLFSILFISNSYSKTFEFEATEIEITNDGNRIKGKKGGNAKTSDGIKIIAETFDYDKIKNILEAYGNVLIIDEIKKIEIRTNEIVYFREVEKIISRGDTNSTINNDTKIFSKNVIFERNKDSIRSKDKTEIIDKEKRKYKLASFNYLIGNEILKGTNIFIEDNTSDKFFFESAIIDLKKKKFLAKDLEINFKKELFDNSENDPRLFGVSAKGDNENIYVDKGLFTTCNKKHKCPPWTIKSSKVRHDKKNQTMHYKDAWLRLYDFPVVYFPKFFHPDPTVQRKSGFLKPNLSNKKTLGTSLYLPYFHVLDQDKDLTFKPRLYDDGKFILQNEYRYVTKNSKHILDFSLINKHKSNYKVRKNTKSHFFSNSIINLMYDELDTSNIEINIEKVSNDTYLKLFDLDSILLEDNPSDLNSYLKLDLGNENFDLISKIELYENLSGSNNDRYEYILPDYLFTTNIDNERIEGEISFNSSGNQKLFDTNVVETNIINDLKYSSNNFFNNLGFKNNYNILLKNINSSGKNSSKYKSSLQGEVRTQFIFDTSFPLKKETPNSRELITPKMSLRFNPNDMKNFKDTDRRIGISNIFSHNRMGLSDTIESGKSVTTGIIYEKFKKISEENKNETHEKYLEASLATLFRDKRENNIPINSTLNNKSSDIFGKINFNPNKNITINYDFSLDNNISTFNYNSIDTKLNYQNWEAELSFVEENGVIGNSNYTDFKSSYFFNKENSFSFSTRRNRKINLTEYYDLLYSYETDCLTAGLQYKKTYYRDRDVEPNEELFFTITIVPITQYSPSNLMNLMK